MLILFNPACFSIVMLILPFLNCTNYVYSSKLKMRYQGENNLLTVISFFFFSERWGSGAKDQVYCLEKENKTQT